MPNDSQQNIEVQEDKEENKTSDYNFLHEDQHVGQENFSDKFDVAFNQSSPAIQNYILSEKFEENIKLICKIEKLDDEKANIIIENITVSVLVGILPINEAKNTMIESFKASGILLEDFSAGLILKNIDAYILSDIRKQILQSKSDTSKEIRHLTLKQSTEEKEKEELRKILLERTGNLNGKGEILVGYKERETNNNPKKETENKETNRDSLLAKLNLKNVSDTDKIKERMAQIKKEEEERLAETELKKKEQEDLREKREKENKIPEAATPETGDDTKKEEEANKENEEISKLFAETLKEKLDDTNHDAGKDLEVLRKERGEQDLKNQSKNPTYYAREMQSLNKDSISSDPNIVSDETFDPYRETF